MARFGLKWRGFRLGAMNLCSFALAFALVSAERSVKCEAERLNGAEESGLNYLLRAVNFLWQSDQLGYQHVWPEMKFRWQIVHGSIVGFFRAAFGSVGGVGGGGIFVPMLSLITGFDPKSTTAISKCMIMGVVATTVYYNLKLRHPTLDLPIIDYDSALLIQPMLMLGISIGVTFNVIFADWMVTVLLIVLSIGTSIKAFLKGVEAWKKETIMKKEAAKWMESSGTSSADVEYKPLAGSPTNGPQKDALDLKSLCLRMFTGRNLNYLFCLGCISCAADC
ncbi:hypothetical protein SLEP1_g51989 [Rubroshorea leprosula]|uniref:Sulfite exporter TauE/SafE family protein n=1 Tax=Rubroshorea leprosula TaxID=152421 RepID=A0AAV5M8A1_9ROSI|nr:hypothetical protein SLEP1_g51989 [Rubroshorea leprosula]